MAGLNKVLLIGHVGRDPEVKYMPTGDAVANFTVATSENYTDKQGQKQEKTEWHKIVVWKKTAEVMGQYLKKGQQVFIEGKLQTRSWDDDKGKHYMTEIVASSVQFLGKKNDSAGAAPATEPQADTQPDKPQPSSDEEDLPF